MVRFRRSGFILVNEFCNQFRHKAGKMILGQRGYLKLDYYPEALTLRQIWPQSMSMSFWAGSITRSMQMVGRLPGEDAFRIQASLSTWILF